MTEILYFTAVWCGPCRSMKPGITKWMTEERAPIQILDIDQNPDLSQQYGVRGIPCFVYVKDGEEVDRVVGATPVSELKNKLAKNQ